MTDKEDEQRARALFAKRLHAGRYHPGTGEKPSGPSLIDKMRALAKEEHPMADELREKADALAKAIEDGDAKRTVGAWARARRVYADATGKPFWGVE